MILIAIGGLSVVAIGAGLAVYKFTDKLEEDMREKKELNDPIKGPYLGSVDLYEKIISKEIEIKLEVQESKKSGLKEYSAKNDYCTLYISKNNTNKYDVIVKNISNKIISLTLDEDKKMENVDYDKNLSLGGDLKEYVLILKKVLESFIDNIKEEDLKEKEAELIFGNINNISSETNFKDVPDIEKIQKLITEKYFTQKDISEKTTECLNYARVLHNLKEHLSLENSHDLNKIINERIYNVLYHYDMMLDSEKNNKKEELLVSLENAKNKLEKILTESKKGHELEFEKQMTLLKK